MRIDPTLRALRSDDAPQRLAQEKLVAARDQWRERAQWQPLSAAFTAYGEGAPLAQCDALAELMVSADAARRLADDFIAHFVPVMGEAQLGQFPLRYSVNGSVSTLLLASSGRAALLLLMIDGAVLATKTRAQAAGFVAGERHEVVLAGSATGRRVTCRPVSSEGAQVECEDMAISAGSCISIDTAREAMLVEEVRQGTFVTLRLQRRGEGLLTARDYSLKDGRLVHQSAGDAEQSRIELMMSLLGRMGRKDAAPLLAAQAMKGTDNLRWQALRECIALDTAEGFRVLTAIAQDAGDALAAHAGAVRAQLLEAHPVLGKIETLEKEMSCLS